MSSVAPDCRGVRELGNGQTKVEQASRAEVNELKAGQSWAGWGRVFFVAQRAAEARATLSQINPEQAGLFR